MGSQAQWLYEQITELYSTKSSIATAQSVTDPRKALALILNINEGNTPLWKNLKNVNSYKDKIFHQYPTLKKIIPIAKCDITALYDILSNISAFPTCLPKYREHLICGSTNSTQHTIVCCYLCLTCTNCQGAVHCNSQCLRFALKFLKKFRNIGAHITPEECRDIEKGIFQYKNIVNCQSWNDLLEQFIVHSENILGYLKRENKISPSEYRKRTTHINMVLFHSSDMYFKLYSNSAANLTNLNWIVPTLEKTCTTLKITLNRKKSLLSKLFWKEPGFEVNEKIASSFIDKTIKLLNDEIGLKQTNNSKLEIFCTAVKPMPASSSGLLPVRVKFDITFSNGDKLPNCYRKVFSQESNELRKNIEKCLKEVIEDKLKVDVCVYCSDWEIASIHITYEIFREKKERVWNNRERKCIEKTIMQMDIPLIHPMLCSTVKISFPSTAEEQNFESYILTICILDDELVEDVLLAIPKIEPILEDLALGKVIAKNSDPSM